MNREQEPESCFTWHWLLGCWESKGAVGCDCPLCSSEMLSCALCCTQGHVHPGVAVLLWQPRCWTSFRCMNFYLASLAFDSLSSCFAYLPPWFGGFVGFSLHWKEFHVCNQIGWQRQDFHLLEWCLEVLGSSTALGSLFSWQMPGEGLVPY